MVNFLPARISALLVPRAAWLTGQNAGQAWRIFRRDRHNHPSPNGGQIEAAFAGAMNVRLGGENYYGGELSMRPYMGDAEEILQAEHIKKTIRLMVVTSLCMVVGGVLCVCCF